MYRPQIKVVDCTIRDGGLMNNWEFPREMVRDVFHKLAEAGVDYVELGYRVDKKMFPPANHGVWRYCDEADVRDVAFACDTRISVMCDVGRTDYDAFLPRSESIIHTIRVATYVKDIDKAIHLINHVKALGYEVTCNVMAVSTNLEPDLDEALRQLADTNVDVVYLVDSYGYFYSEQIHYLADKYKRILNGKELGIHCHNNQQLAFANTIEGIIKGINWVDGSIFGMGRAAGNCPTEMLLGFLKNPKFRLAPVLELIEKYFIRMKDESRWGYEVPYMITGMLNKHPRTGLAFVKEVMEGTQQKSLADFYNMHMTPDGVD
ncbi:MAG TPA: aldolase catalytic domain-containing protein [Candidatus Hydrogenedentes bacterium]|nr:aldolase catalytic domain-containing protein [Candidatus Hydrogenedentota bacterium]